MDRSVNEYNSSISSLIEKHAPVSVVRSKGDKPKPWYSDDIHSARQERRRRERRWLKSGLEVHRECYFIQWKTVVRMIDQAKQDYYKSLFGKANPSDMFNIVKELLCPNVKLLPNHSCENQLAEKFSYVFKEKIDKIRCDISAKSILSQGLIDETKSCHGSKLDAFNSVSATDLKIIIHKMTKKTCSLDPWPTWMLHTYLDVVLPAITYIVNSSLSSGAFPTALKCAIIRPVLKKQGLERDILTNYRPVSNLPFLGKVIEKAVSLQVTNYLSQHHLGDPLQSAYKAGHSCETALLKVTSDIQLALDDGEGMLMAMLDLSAAYDLVDHDILLSRMKSQLGFSGMVLKWFNSYLKSRTQMVVIGSAQSNEVPLTTGVPQGSILGSLLYLIYVLPLKYIFEKHNISYHCFADDIQIYNRFSLKQDGLTSSLKKLEMCIAEVKEWFDQSKLKINSNKTEFVVFISRYNQHKVNLSKCVLHVGSDIIYPSKCARNLGSYLDENLSMKEHVSTAVRSVYWNIRSVGKIRRYLDENTCASLLNALVTSRLDYNNSLLFGVPDTILNMLQAVQNHAARILTGTRMSDHITPVFISLHWLPVRERIKYKILVTVYKCLHQPHSPQYLKDLLQQHVPARLLRSSNDPSCLVVPRTRTAIGDRAFAACAPRLWNNLPSHLRSANSLYTFKNILKPIFLNRHLTFSKVL